MKLARPHAADRVVAAFDGAPRGDRFHVRYRWASAPFEAVARQVPDRGRILEVGCGHGLCSMYLAASAPARPVVGVDLDAHKIELARDALVRLAADGGPPLDVTVEVAPAGVLPPGPFDAVVIVDVLYLLGRSGATELLREAATRLAPGGRLVVKEMGDRPNWKRRVTVAQEHLATRVLRITAGERVELVDPAVLVAAMHDAGLVTSEIPVHAGYPYAHHLVVGVAAPGPTGPGG